MSGGKTVTMYGIRNCDSVKKARAWLEERGIAYDFHDFKKEGLDAARLGLWESRVGWEILLNRSGTSFRKLPDSERANLSAHKAAQLMLTQPSMIKRPVLDVGGRILVGFTEAAYAAVFA